MAQPRVKLADLLGKRKEKEVLMNYQKTKNCRDKKKMEERAAKKREASKLKYSAGQIKRNGFIFIKVKRCSEFRYD